MNIVLFSGDEIAKPLSLRDCRAAHICGILRKKKGDSFEAGIINGSFGRALITEVDADFLHFEFTAEGESEPLFPLALIIGFPRPIQLKRLLRGVSSLGAGEIHLTGTELGEKSYMKSGLAERANAEAALIDGAVQAKSTHVPALFFHNTVADCLKYFEHRAFDGQDFDVRLTLDNVCAQISLPQAARTGAYAGKKIAAAVGSERGWTDTERVLFEQSGFARCSLGRRVLRTETAAVAGTALLLTAMQVL